MKQIALLAMIVLSLSVSCNISAALHNEKIILDRLPSSKIEEIDAINLILIDHSAILALLLKLEDALNFNIKESRVIFKEFKVLLKRHERMEEIVWYPEVEQYPEFKKIIQLLLEQEVSSHMKFMDIALTINETNWRSKVKSLISVVKRHIFDEETRLFPAVMKRMSEEELLLIGRKIQEYKMTEK